MLPICVSSSPEKMPRICLYESNMNVLMTMLKNFDGKFGHIWSNGRHLSRHKRLKQVTRARRLCLHV